jgi:hypothetical protein
LRPPAETRKSPSNFSNCPPVSDWALTVVFYAVVHYGRAFTVAHGAKATTSHKAFDSQFFQASGDKQRYYDYRTLKDASEAARYDCIDWTVDEVRRMRDKHLTPFKAFVMADPEVAKVK